MTSSRIGSVDFMAPGNWDREKPNFVFPTILSKCNCGCGAEEVVLPTGQKDWVGGGTVLTIAKDLRSDSVLPDWFRDAWIDCSYY